MAYSSFIEFPNVLQEHDMEYSKWSIPTWIDSNNCIRNLETSIFSRDLHAGNAPIILIDSANLQLSFDEISPMFYKSMIWNIPKYGSIVEFT